MYISTHGVIFHITHALSLSLSLRDTMLWRSIEILRNTHALGWRHVRLRVLCMVYDVNCLTGTAARAWPCVSWGCPWGWSVCGRRCTRMVARPCGYGSGRLATSGCRTACRTPCTPTRLEAPVCPEACLQAAPALKQKQVTLWDWLHQNKRAIYRA